MTLRHSRSVERGRHAKGRRGSAYEGGARPCCVFSPGDAATTVRSHCAPAAERSHVMDALPTNCSELLAACSHALDEAVALGQLRSHGFGVCYMALALGLAARVFC